MHARVRCRLESQPKLRTLGKNSSLLELASESSTAFWQVPQHLQPGVFCKHDAQPGFLVLHRDLSLLSSYCASCVPRDCTSAAYFASPTVAAAGHCAVARTSV